MPIALHRVLPCPLHAAGTDFIVDGFAFQSPRCRHYFLTHMHSDHTVGLRRSFDAGTIWASPVSAALLGQEWGLCAPTVQVLQLNTPRLVDGVRVTALDANHCPGAVMLLFEAPRQGGGETRVLHTGDCRSARRHGGRLMLAPGCAVRALHAR